MAKSKLSYIILNLTYTQLDSATSTVNGNVRQRYLPSNSSDPLGSALINAALMFAVMQGDNIDRWVVPPGLLSDYNKL